MIRKDLFDKLPISLEEIQPLIDRIHARYPVISRYEVVIIIKSFFETIRHLMIIDGSTLSINSLWANFFLNVYPRSGWGKSWIEFRVKLTTPRDIRVQNDNK